MKMKFTTSTIALLYCKDSAALLSYLLIPNCSNAKTIITYGKDAEIKIPNNTTRFNAINISRNGKEYKGFLNKYYIMKG